MRKLVISLRNRWSTREVVDHLDSIRPKVTPYSKELLVGTGVGPLLSPASPDDSLPSTQDEDEDATSQSPESSCVSAQDYWETGGESDLRDESERDEEEGEEDFGGGGGGGGGGLGGVNDSHEERRLNERSFPRSYPQSSRRPRRRTKKRHHSHSPQDSSTRCQSSEDDERSSSYLRSLTSEEEEPTRYDPVPSDVVSCQPATQSVRPASPVSREPSLGLSELLNAGEPVTSDRGSWGMREASHCDSWHRTAPRYSRFDDESTMQSNWYRSDEDDIILSPRASEAFKDVGPANGSEDYKTPPGQGAVKILMKNINSIKKKIKRYEEEFESAFGYRPSHSEKMKHKEIKKYMSELSKARKELKQMKDDVAGMMSVPTVFPLSLLRCQESTNPNARPKNTSGTADTIRQVEDRLREKRTASGRPLELTNMNKTEMQEEKTALQKALLYYESVHGRPTTREDRDLARPLYDRYRQVKRIVMRSSSRAKENMVELAPILEHEAMDFTLASPQHRGSLQGDEIEKISLPPSPPSTPPVFDSPVFEAPQTTTTTTTTTTMPGDDPKDTRRGVPLGDLHALPLSELRERKKEARDEKKKLRRALREFEETFERDMGRKVQKEDRGPMEQTYLDYKHAKAKLRLLEALLSKHEPHKV
ncbi:protein FAM13A-like isoform X4 [Penaeus indicus]|uniref:protein FAM13A-like isoform X4 n=1 Tax=Penaeus indicus TaxID=29960 RepID=UPI00300CFEFE